MSDDLEQRLLALTPAAPRQSVVDAAYEAGRRDGRSQAQVDARPSLLLHRAAVAAAAGVALAVWLASPATPRPARVADAPPAVIIPSPLAVPPPAEPAPRMSWLALRAAVSGEPSRLPPSDAAAPATRGAAAPVPLPTNPPTAAEILRELAWADL